MPHNKLKSAIRACQAATGESYTTARAAVLAERGLPPEIVVKAHGRIVDRHDFGHGERVLRVTVLQPSDDPTEET